MSLDSAISRLSLGGLGLCAMIGVVGVTAIGGSQRAAPLGAGGHPISVARGGGGSSPDAVGAAGAPAESDVASDAPRPCRSDGSGYVVARIPRAARGIPCPDGTFLPPLNGVGPDDPIPSIQREPFMPPIGAIVGRFTDSAGHDWWVTGDGSAFTTRWVTIRTPDGRLARMVRLDQSDALLDGVEVALSSPDGSALRRPR